MRYRKEKSQDLSIAVGSGSLFEKTFSAKSWSCILMRINELLAVVNEVGCCVFRRNNSRKVACFEYLWHLKVFLSLVFYHYFHLNVNYRKER